MAKETPSIQLALAGPSQPATLRVRFPGGTAVSESGVRLTTTQAKESPTWSLPSSNAKPGQKYMVISIDLDAPFPSAPFLGPILHGLQLDLMTGADDGTGWSSLVPGAEPLVPYVGPAPPPLSGPHRYVFLLWEQPEGLDAKQAREGLGLGEQVGMTGRMWWKEAEAEKKLGLGKALGGCYFLCN